MIFRHVGFYYDFPHSHENVSINANRCVCMCVDRKKPSNEYCSTEFTGNRRVSTNNEGASDKSCEERAAGCIRNYFTTVARGCQPSLTPVDSLSYHTKEDPAMLKPLLALAYLGTGSVQKYQKRSHQ